MMCRNGMYQGQRRDFLYGGGETAWAKTWRLTGAWLCEEKRSQDLARAGCALESEEEIKTK